MLFAAEKECFAPFFTVPGLLITAFGDSALNTLSPVGVPTPDTPSYPGRA